MNGLSLFSGIGGFDLAMERAGINLVGMCEIDKNAQVVLRRHYPNVPLFDDVKKVGVNTHERGTIDVICGGFPCQDLSVAGKRAGLAGERSGLWYEFARIIDELEPGWVVIENVPGLLSSDKGRDFAIILRWLVVRGYGVSWRILDAQNFGVPQRRRRVFVVGSFGNGSSAEVLFESKSLSRDTKKSVSKGQATAGTFTVRSGGDGGGKGYLGQESLAMTLGGQPQWAYSIREDATKNNFSATPLDVANALSALQPSTQSHHAQTFIVQDNVAHTLRANAKQSLMSGDGVINETLVFQKQRIDEYKQDTVASTVSARDYKSATDLVSTVGVRRLTPTECERLQGFPDSWTEGQADTQRYKQLGNAVAVPVVEWIIDRIWKHEKSSTIIEKGVQWTLS